MSEARPFTASAESPDGLGWRSLTPSLSIAVFLIVAVFTIDSSGDTHIGLALIAGALIGPLASYLLYTYWPRIRTGDRSVPRPPSPG